MIACLSLNIEFAKMKRFKDHQSGAYSFVFSFFGTVHEFKLKHPEYLGE